MIKKILLITISSCLLISDNTFAKQYLIDTNFLQSMTHGDHEVAKRLEYGDFFRFQAIYNAKKPSQMTSSTTPIIPKIMHQIWIGGSKLPPLYDHYLQECKILHPDWEFKLWGDYDVQKLDMKHRDLYNAARSFQAKADVLRYEILSQYGGVYRDCDIKCIRPLDELLHKYDFFAALDNYHNNKDMVSYYNPNIELKPLDDKDVAMNLDNKNSSVILINSFIGATPGHKIISDTLNDIESNFYRQWQQFDNEISDIDTLPMVILTTLYPLKTAFLKNTTLHDKAVVFPVSYLLPMYQYRLPRGNGLIDRIKSVAYDIYTLNDHTFGDITLPQEALLNQNQPRYEIQLPKWGTKMLNKYYNKYSSNLSALNKHRLMLASSLTVYNDEMPFNQTNIIPQRLLFVVLDDQEEVALQSVLPDWQLLNRSFEIDIWNKSRLAQEMQELILKAQSATHSLEELRFLLAIELLNKKGGHYADFRAKPIQPIFELGNKYKFYGSIAPLDGKHLNVEMSTRLIGSEAASPILSESLDKFYSTQFPIIESLLDVAIKNKLLYSPIIVLPSTAFHPIPYKYGKWTKLWNVLTNKRDLYGTTVYSVVEDPDQIQ